MTQELLKEFECYLEDLSAGEEPLLLPEYLSDYEIVACMQDTPQKKTFLIKTKKGQKMLCKYACDEFQIMLRTEYEVSCLSPFPFLPYIIDYCETPEGSVLLREYVEGKTLRELVEEDGPLPLTDVLPIIQKVSDCLMHLHDSTPALIHRDIKPANIVLTNAGDCYLVDMGTLRHYQEDGASDTFCMGTSDFAAPEQFGARQTDVRTDIYELGALFYYLLTGKTKVQEATFAEIPKSVSTFIKKCTAFNPKDRYDNMHQVQTELTKLYEIRKTSWLQLVACVTTFLSLALLLALIIPKFNFGNKEIVFSSPLLEKAVRQELGKNDNEKVYQKDLEKITNLKICGNMVLNADSDHNFYNLPRHKIDDELTQYGNISDISLLAMMPNLSQLVLDEQKITDISPLKGLPLVSVSLFGNPINDLSPLSGCETLYEIDISYTKVQSFDQLASCSGLQVIHCTNTPVKSVAPLADSGLVQLRLMDTHISDFSPLENVPLRHLECSHISEESLEQIRRIKTLQELDIFHSNFPTLQAFGGLEKITDLTVGYSNLQSLEGIENLPNLKCFNMTHNPITELTPIPTLLILLIDGTGIRDFSFLNEMPALTEFTISEAQRPYLMEAVPEPWFEIRYQ